MVFQLNLLTWVLPFKRPGYGKKPFVRERERELSLISCCLELRDDIPLSCFHPHSEVKMGSKCCMQMSVLSLLCMILIFFTIPRVEGRSISWTTSTSTPGLVRRNLMQTNNYDKIARTDPLDNFNKYRGYNITNKHYWSSVIYTGIYGYALGALWLLSGIIYGGTVLAISFCCKSRRYKLKKTYSYCHQKQHLTIHLAVLFTILVIVGSGLVLGGSIRFHLEANSMVNIIIETANEASGTLYSTSRAMKDMSNMNLSGEASSSSSSSYQISNDEAASFVLSTSEKLNIEAYNISLQAEKNRRLINRGLKIVYVMTTVMISLNLVGVIALLAFGILRLRRAFYMFIILCWLLTVLCWLFFGLYFFLDKFSNDTCTALESFQENPNNNSLSSIVPCQQLLSAKPVLTDIATGIYQLVNEVNENISKSYPTFGLVCNPFSDPPHYQYQPEKCAADTIRIGDIPKVLKILTCSESTKEKCGGEQFISNNIYETVKAYTSSIQVLLNVYPKMESLVECEVVKEAFSEILMQHCKPLKRYVHMVWSAMVFLSVVMMFLILIWTRKAHDCDKEKHSFSDGSHVTPQSDNSINLSSVISSKMIMEENHASGNSICSFQVQRLDRNIGEDPNTYLIRLEKKEEKSRLDVNYTS